MKEFIIAQNDADQRLDKFIFKSVPTLPKSMLYKAIRKKRIKVNQKRTEISYRLCVGDRVQLYLNDEWFENTTENTFLKAPADITVVYEDEQILLVNKPQGLVVHEDNDNTVDTLIHRVLHYLYQKGDYDPETEQSFVPALCNRIDRNTCGIVIVAKTAAAGRLLYQKIKDRQIDKQYLCVVLGTPSQKTATIKHYLQKLEQENTVKVFDKPNTQTKTAITDYRVLQTKGELSLLEVTLHTGRTHQIRAQMAHIGHPLLGDGKYGQGAVNRRYRYRSQLLCAYRLTFHFEKEELLHYLDGKSFTLEDIWFVGEEALGFSKKGSK